eukprot:COSAG02_NODE_5287_length_4470_cov_1.463052_4_plen_123_part_00
MLYRYTKLTADRGIGAFASRSICEDEFIGEYCGEVIMAADLESPERRDSEYIFDLGDQFAVDARSKGNKTRRLNHADTPHANVRANVINHFGIRKVCMYAARDINENEELLFDYGPKYWSEK